MRSPLTVTTFILLVIVIGVFHITYTFHEARQAQIALDRAEFRAAIENKCKYVYPDSERRQEGCVQGIMGDE